MPIARRLTLAAPLAFALLATVPVLAAAQTQTETRTMSMAQHVHTLLLGRWEGTLEYKDYQKPDKRVTLPTALNVTPDTQGVAMRFVYDDGPGKTVTSDDRWIVAANGRTVDWTGVKDKSPSIFTVTGMNHGAGGQMVLVLEREGTDDDKPATLRETVTLGEKELTVLKEVRFGAGEAFTFRHVYNFQKR